MSTKPVPIEIEPGVEPLPGQPDATPAARKRSRQPLSERRLAQLRWILPVLVTLVTLGLVVAIFVSRPEPELVPREVVAPPVRVLVAAPQALTLTVTTQGSVAPRTESDLVAEVAGRVVWVSPKLVAGGFFAEGEELLRFDGRDHQIAAQRAEAQVKRGQSEARLADADADRRRALFEQGAVSDADLELMESRREVASAALAEARASLAKARLDLERTNVRAPYDGRVRERIADVGQFVSPGAVLARIQATDYAEVRLPVPTEDLAHLDVPLSFGNNTQLEAKDARAVTLRASYAGQNYSWPATLARTEGEIDVRTRMLHVVARVDDPYRLAPDAEGPPLAAGLFVSAEIQGRALEGAFVLPGAALRDGDQVLVLDAEDRVRFRDVEVIRRGREEVILGAGLAADDRVVVSPMSAVTDGMAVRPLASSPPPSRP
jgi:RND family efflux transporter MFP subunit